MEIYYLYEIIYLKILIHSPWLERLWNSNGNIIEIFNLQYYNDNDNDNDNLFI